MSIQSYVALPVIYALYCLWPGFLLTRLLRIRRLVWLASVSLSLFLLVSTLLVFRAVAIPTVHFNAVMLTELVGLTVAWLIGRPWQAGQTVRRSWARTVSAWVGPLALVVAMIGYFLYAGAYTEVPADVWTHLHLVRFRLQDIQAGQVAGSFGTAFSSLSSAGPFVGHLKTMEWYWLQAFLCRQAGVDVADALVPLSVIHVAGLLLSLYGFALWVFRDERLSVARKRWVAVLTAVFFALGMGVSVFAYIRYYALGPAIINYTLALMGVGLAGDYLRGRETTPRTVGLLVMVGIPLAVLHIQEALLVGCLVWGMAWVSGFQPFRAKGDAPGVRPRAWLVVGLGLIAFGIAAYLARQTSLPALSGRWVVPLQGFIPFCSQLLIVSPTTFVLWVLGLWGTLLYVLFTLTWPRFKNNPFVVAGMTLPLWTIFNPVAVDLFLRLGVPESSLYRFGYLIPLPFVAAYVWVWTAPRWFVRNRGTPNPADRAALGWKPCLCFVVIGVVAWGSLFPIQTRYLQNPSSRLYTLRPVPEDNDWRVWQDLVAYFRTQPPGGVIADPVTGYVLFGMTGHWVLADRFDKGDLDWWLRSPAPEQGLEAVFSCLGPTRIKTWRVVVNERDGGLSQSGWRSGHWPANVLKVSRFYSPALKQFLAQHPERFSLVWQQSGIQVYDVIQR